MEAGGHVGPEKVVEIAVLAACPEAGSGENWESVLGRDGLQWEMGAVTGAGTITS